MARNAVFTGSLLVAMCVLAGTAVAEEPPTTQPASPAPEAAATTPAAPPDRLLTLELLKFQLGAEGAYDRRRTDFETNDRARRNYRQTNRTYRLEETIGFDIAGSLIDERILAFQAQVEGGLSQERFFESGPWRNRDESPDGSLFNYDISLNFLPHGRISGTTYAQRLDSRVPRAFLPSLDRTLERYGGGLYFNDAHLPMRISFEHQWDSLTSRTGELLDDERRGLDKLRYEATWQIDTNHAVRLEYEYEDRHELYSGSDTRFDTTRNYLTLNHTLRFGEDQRSLWETLVRWQDETGELGRDLAEFSTRLRLQHTKQLASNFALQYLRDRFQELSIQSWRSEGGVTYQFSEDLTATAQLYNLQQDADKNADFNEWGGLANVAYSRENTLGRLSANLSYNHVATTTRNGTRRGIIIGESVTFRDPLPSYLAHTDIDRGSIVVTDAARSRTYLAGRDYFAIEMGGYTALVRLPTGQITDRATVLVSYTYRVFNNYDLSRDRVDFRLQQAFHFGLTPYYAASIQDEDQDHSRFLHSRARNVNRHRIGATYRQRRWSVGVEYEYNDDAIDPYQALHGNGDVVIWQNLSNQVDGRANCSRFWFDGSDGLESHNTTLVDAGLGYRHFLARQLEIDASAMYRYEDDSLYGLTHGVDLSSAVEWRIGYFSLRFEAEYDLLDLPDSRDNDLSFWIKLRRDVPVVGENQP